MAKLPLFFKGNSVDYTNLTATETAVRTGKKFIGQGTDDVRTGTVPEHAATNYSLPINGTYNIPAGIHNGIDTINQSIPTMAGQYVTPSSGSTVIECAGKYMTGDIVVYAVDNLSPEMIKYGVTVGEGDGAVVGTFQGFVD